MAYVLGRSILLAQNWENRDSNSHYGKLDSSGKFCFVSFLREKRFHVQRTKYRDKCYSVYSFPMSPPPLRSLETKDTGPSFLLVRRPKPIDRIHLVNGRAIGSDETQKRSPLLRPVAPIPKPLPRKRRRRRTKTEFKTEKKGLGGTILKSWDPTGK